MPYLHQVHAYLVCAACWFAVMTYTCNRNEQRVVWLHPSAPAIVTFYMHIVCADTSYLGGLTCLLQGCTALHHAAANGSTEAVRVLCHWGGDVNASDAVVCSIIYLAALTAHMTLILVCSMRVQLHGCLCVSSWLI